MFGAAWPDLSLLRAIGFGAAGYMLDSYVVIMAGLLLIIPGLISDAVGLLLLIAPLRRFLIRRAVGDIYDHPLVAGRGPRAGVERPVIDATYERHDPDPEDRLGER